MRPLVDCWLDIEWITSLSGARLEQAFAHKVIDQSEVRNKWPLVKAPGMKSSDHRCFGLSGCAIAARVPKARFLPVVGPVGSVKGPRLVFGSSRRFPASAADAYTVR